MAAFAGDRNPAAAGVNEPGNAETGSGAEHDAAGVRLGLAAADLLHVFRPERDDGERLRLEIVEHETSDTPVVASMPRGFTTHGQLVSGISSPFTGPATAITVERGWTAVVSMIALRIASSIVA